MALGEVAHILIVEDEPLIAMDLQGLLNDLGYKNVHHAESISRAFALLDAVRPYFAILDVNIGRDTVFAVAEKLAAWKLPLIFLTAVSWDRLPVEWRRYPVPSKPVTRAALDAAMHGLRLWNTTVAGAARYHPAAEGCAINKTQPTLGMLGKTEPLLRFADPCERSADPNEPFGAD